MSQILGAELIVIYVTDVDKDILEYLWTHYPDTVRTVEWKKFEMNYPFHYYGQNLVVTDCNYRLMYEVEYLSIIDLDEMIFPVKLKNWSEMMETFPANDTYSGFVFQNGFFDYHDFKTGTHPMPNCSDRPIPKYFAKTERHNCHDVSNVYSYRTKLMIKPQHILQPSVHNICVSIEGHAEQGP